MTDPRVAVLEAELARLREPLGDEGAELVAHLRDPVNNWSNRYFEMAAAYIERQAAELARKTAVSDAQWEIVESFKAENAELRTAWEKVRAQIEAEVGGPDLSRSDGLRKALAILAQHAGAANRLDKEGAD